MPVAVALDNSTSLDSFRSEWVHRHRHRRRVDSSSDWDFDSWRDSAVASRRIVCCNVDRRSFPTCCSFDNFAALLHTWHIDTSVEAVRVVAIAAYTVQFDCLNAHPDGCFLLMAVWILLVMSLALCCYLSIYVAWLKKLKLVEMWYRQSEWIYLFIPFAESSGFIEAFDTVMEFAEIFDLFPLFASKPLNEGERLKCWN